MEWRRYWGLKWKRGLIYKLFFFRERGKLRAGVRGYGQERENGSWLSQES